MYIYFFQILLNFFKKTLAKHKTLYYNNFCVLQRTQTADTGHAPLAQLVEHLTLNQGVQGSSPWRCIERTGFGDFSALGLVLFLCSSLPGLPYVFDSGSLDETCHVACLF